MLKSFFINLSENQLLNKTISNYGFKFGAQNIVAGTNIEEAIESIKRLNVLGISCTVDNLGEFVNDRAEAEAAKKQVLGIIEAIHEHNVDSHISLKPSQLGLDIDYDYCRANLHEVVSKAEKYGIFVNFDMENFERLQSSFDLLDGLSKNFDNIGTVIQAYFFRAEEDIQKYSNYRMRIVKGAYKESEAVAYQSKNDIDTNYIKLIEWHLLNGKFTSIATHDHHVINHVKKFVKDYGIPYDKFEFQMLYGFRKDMQLILAREGYNFCTYIPFGTDWYGYFMRRLAERPQNINLITKQIFNKKKKVVLGTIAGAFLLGRMSRK